MENFVKEIEFHLKNTIVPFWKKLRDNEYGGYYGWVGYDLSLDKKAEKGCILNSRITWFFASAYMVLKDESLLDEARHGFEFLREKCVDNEYGGIYWSLNYDGTCSDGTKHTYNQAFAIYALSAYYEATKDEQALNLAMNLFYLIESKCCDKDGYLEAFTRDWKPHSNEKLSENGVMADRTMNTVLHVLEAYTQLYKVSGAENVKHRLIWILGLIQEKIYNPELFRQEVFFDKNYKSLIDLHSYGHDIESSWLIDLALDVIHDQKISDTMSGISSALVQRVFDLAFDGHSLANECEKGIVNEHRIWWVQAETLVGLVNAYQRRQKKEFLDAAKAEWNFIKNFVIDKRNGSEWFWEVNADGKPYPDRPIVESWKCPYHNGRMCLEIIKRMGDVGNAS